MAAIELAPGALEDFDRIFDHVAQHDVEADPVRITAILQTLEVLTLSPLIGRPHRNAQRELVIGQRSRGYVALYRYLSPIDRVLVLAIRAQRARAYARR